MAFVRLHRTTGRHKGKFICVDTKHIVSIIPNPIDYYFKTSIVICDTVVDYHSSETEGSVPKIAVLVKGSVPMLEADIKRAERAENWKEGEFPYGDDLVFAAGILPEPSETI